jgi:glutamyl-Q tRNA(Asp) synthetase
LLAATGSYLQARAAGGQWLLRIEDIDRPRVAPGADRSIIDTLAAFGFEWDGPIVYQSQRLELYDAALARLQNAGRLFPCTCSRTQIAAWHAVHGSPTTTEDGDELRYPGTCRQKLGQAPVQTDFAIRIALPAQATFDFVDLIQGPQRDDLAASSGDFVVRRRDGFHAYHLAVVVDDGAQNVTEVVRGADLLASTGRHLVLQRALGLPSPRYGHLPLAVDRLGQKLSKSSQAMPIDSRDPLPALWELLECLRLSPPPSLRRGPLGTLWAWAVDHWSLAPLKGILSCPAPSGLANSGG